MKKIASFKHVGINDFWLMLVGIPLLTYAISTLFFANSFEEGWHCYRDNFLAATLSTAIYWLGSRQITVLFRRKFASSENNRKRVIYTSLTILIFIVATTAIMKVLDDHAPREEPNIFRDSPFSQKLGAVVFASITVLSIYEAIFYFSQWRASSLFAERLQKENTISQLEALKNQVNPHFLFNSLNTLTAIIPEDPPRAVKFVQRLSLVYRNILELKAKPVITVSEELDCLENFIFLVRERFGENLRIHVEIPQPLRDRYIVPLALQVLVENAIKHNIASAKKPLTILIRNSGDDWLSVENNLQLKSGREEGTGTGLNNIHERFRLALGTGIQVEELPDTFRVLVPIVEIPEL